MLNRDFVPIKVDREERPDVDRIYMTFVQATTGGGGWPMSVWLTPELQAVLRRHLLSAREPLRPCPASRPFSPRSPRPGATTGAQIVESAREAVEQLAKQAAVDSAGAGSRPAIDYAAAR